MKLVQGSNLVSTESGYDTGSNPINNHRGNLGVDFVFSIYVARIAATLNGLLQDANDPAPPFSVIAGVTGII